MVIDVVRTVEVQHLSDATDTNLKDSIPDMPRALAITCLICNIVLPGLGECIILINPLRTAWCFDALCIAEA